MTRREAEERKVDGMLDMDAILTGSLRLLEGQGNEKYNILEFRMPPHTFFFKQEQAIILKFKEKEISALIIRIHVEDGGCCNVRCFVKGGYDALGR